MKQLNKAKALMRKPWERKAYSLKKEERRDYEELKIEIRHIPDWEDVLEGLIEGFDPPPTPYGYECLKQQAWDIVDREWEHMEGRVMRLKPSIRKYFRKCYPGLEV